MLIADREIAADSADPIPIDPKGNILQVLVRDNNIDQALRFLKKKMQREGVFREMKQRRFYEKPSERTNREKAEAIRRARKVARKKLQREGLLPDPRKMKPDASKSPRQRPAFESRPSQGQFPRPTGNVAR